MGPEPAPSLEELVGRAQQGDRQALEAVVEAVHDDVRRLALRFLWHPEDADDVTQDILIRIVTRLSTFRGESRFRTWVFQVAVNTLRSWRRGRMEERVTSFEDFGDDLAEGLVDHRLQLPAAEEALLLEEVKIGCTHAMLLCLGRGQRLAYLLGEILELDQREAAEVLEISPAAFRQRLSRARRKLTTFMKEHCGLFDAINACRCRKRVAPAIAKGRVQPGRLLFAHDAARARSFPRVLAEVRRLEETRRATALLRSHPEPRVRRELVPRLQALLGESG